MRYAPLRILAVLLLMISTAAAEGHDVFGTVEVSLKGDKKKSDLSSVIVYLDTVPGSKYRFQTQPVHPAQKSSMATKNKQFAPRALAVALSAKVDFPNQDPIFHNIFSVSTPNDFDLGLYKGGSSKSKSFQAPGIVKVFCNVHPQMTATINVTASPYSSLADEKGNFRMPAVESGSYTLRAYSDEGQASQKIQVGDVPLQVKVTIDGKNFKKIRHKNKFGKDYSTNEDEKY